MCVLRVSPCSLSFSTLWAVFRSGCSPTFNVLAALELCGMGPGFSFHLGRSGADMWYFEAELESQSHVQISIFQLTSSRGILSQSLSLRAMYRSPSSN